MSIFKAYDIRGGYGESLNEEIAYKIGRCLPQVVPGKRAVIGRDARPSSQPLENALVRGLLESGYDVDLAGLTSTPMIYYLTARHDYDLSIQITASHNPTEYNGFKISRSQARPVGYDTGLDRLEALVAAALPAPGPSRGREKEIECLPEFLDFLRQWQKPDLGLHLAVDCSDGLAALTAKPLFDPSTRFIADIPDGNFPSHSPNPLESEARQLLVDCVLANKLDAGIIFDGDVDRVMFVDENGEFVRPDIMIAIMAPYFLATQPGAGILQDIRTSRLVSRDLAQAGATTHLWKVGHAFAKARMRELGTIFGGELAGHYYFKDFFWCDSGELAALVALSVLDEIKLAGKTFSEALQPYRAIPNTGELNYRVSDSYEALEEVARKVKERRQPDLVLDFDGYRIEYPDWWMSVRRSNTEPYLRLILEAESASLLAEKRQWVEQLLQPYMVGTQ